MIKNILITLCILASLSEMGYSQTKKIKIKDPSLNFTFEEIRVLKTDHSIREGAYKRTISGELAVKGAYKNGERTGIWKTYNRHGEVELEINYDTGGIKFLTKDSVTRSDVMKESSLVPEGDRPVLNITGSKMVLNYLVHLVQYPPDAARKGISGKVIVAVKINSKGEIADYIVDTSIDKSLDDEAIRVVKLMPLEFLPAYENGEPIDSEIKIPVNFIMNSGTTYKNTLIR